MVIFITTHVVENAAVRNQMPKHQWLAAAAIIVILGAVVAYLILTHSIGLGGTGSPSHTGY